MFDMRGSAVQVYEEVKKNRPDMESIATSFRFSDIDAMEKYILMLEYFIENKVFAD